jgi:hypothetical protein
MTSQTPYIQVNGADLRQLWWHSLFNSVHIAISLGESLLPGQRTDVLYSFEDGQELLANNFLSQTYHKQKVLLS